MTIDRLAYFGGNKSINTPKPHWLWPPNSKQKIRAVVDYLNNPKLNSKGYPECVEEFEKSFAKYINRDYVLSMNSGTSTLYSAFYAIGVKEGLEVLAPSLTFHATASPIIQCGGTPILCDCEPDTGNISVIDIEKKINKNTIGVVITHLCGHPCEMDQIIDICRKYNLFLIEDCSHAHGSTYKGKKVGTFGDIACFSLDSNKILASGEGGVFVTDNKEFFERALLVSDFGPRLKSELKSKDVKKYYVTGLGHKHRVHPVSATIANIELKNLEKYIQLRFEKLSYLSNKLNNIDGITPPVTKPYVTRGAHFGYRPFIDKPILNNISIDNFIILLAAEGMELRRSSHLPLHQLHYFIQIQKLKKTEDDFKNCEYFYNSTISIPTFTFEPLSLIDEYVYAFNKVCKILAKEKITNAKMKYGKNNHTV